MESENGEWKKTDPFCGDGCAYYSEWTENQAPLGSGMNWPQHFAECDPPTPEGMTEEEIEAAIEAAIGSGKPCPAYEPRLISGRCPGGCGRVFEKEPITNLYFFPGVFETEFACSPDCADRGRAAAEKEIRELTEAHDG